MNQFEHGGNFGADIFDFSVNINPMGLPESVKRKLAENISSFSLYPDPYCAELVRNLSEHEKVPENNIVCGNGAADLIYRLVYAVRPKRGLVLSPTFSEYEKALSEIGCMITHHQLKESENFMLTKRIFDDLHDVDIFFLCNPNNPAGTVIEPELMDKIIKKCEKEKILLAVDECFLGFVEDSKKYAVKISENVVIIKAFTKLYAMAGLRLGYMLCGNKALVEKVRNTGQCWSVSLPAQLAGITALDDLYYIENTIDLIKNERKYLTDSLSTLGLKVYPSQANFLLFRCEKPLDKLLIKEKIAIRNCGNFRGLDHNYFRIAVKKHTDNTILINAAAKILKEN